MRKILLSLFLAVSLVAPVFAQDTLTDVTYVWDSFEGGLNTKLSPFSLPRNQATICENVRLGKELKALVKRNDIRLYGQMNATEAATGIFRQYLSNGTKTLIGVHGDEIKYGIDSNGTFIRILNLTTGDYRWQWLTWNNVAIGTDGQNQPVKYDGVSANATYLGTCLATPTASGAGPTGNYSYKVSFNTTTYEVIFNVTSNSVYSNNKDINLSMIPIGPTTYGGETIGGRKIYRNKEGGSTWYLLSNGNLTDNVNTTLTDSDSDAELTAVTYPAGTAPNATWTPPKGKLCLIHKNRLWIANNPIYPSRLYYSDDGSYDRFNNSAYFNIRPDDGDEITFIKNLLGKMVVSKTNTIQIMDTTGDTPASDWGYSDPYSFVGCQAYYSAVNSPLGILYLSRDGIYKFNGAYSQLISEAVTPVIKDISDSNFASTWGEYHKGIYYLAYTSKESGSSTNNRVLLFDILANAYSIDYLPINCFCTFNSGSDWGVLYSGSSENGNVYNHAEASYEMVHNKHSDFNGTWVDARYVPVSVGGNAANPVIEVSRTANIENLTGTIEDMIGTIARNSTKGNYTSPVLDLGASSLDKLYWYERFNQAGEDITFRLRAGATSGDCQAASWSSVYTNPAGSDVSGATAERYVQYHINMTCNNYTDTPNLYKGPENYVIKLLYNKEGNTTESSVPMHWRSGWTDLGTPGRVKSLKKLNVYHSGIEGNITLKFSNLEGDSDTFVIDLTTNPTSYEEYFTNGKFLGTWFNLDITKNDLYDATVNKVIINLDVEPLI